MHLVYHLISDLRRHRSGSIFHQAGSSRTAALRRRQPMVQCQPSIEISLEEEVPS